MSELKVTKKKSKNSEVGRDVSVERISFHEQKGL